MNAHNRFLSLTRNTLYIAFTFLFMSLAHAEESAIDVEARSSDAAPTQEGIISPNNLAAFEKFSTNLGTALTTLKDARDASRECTLEFKAGKKDSQAHIKRQDCVIVALGKMKKAHKSLSDSFSAFNEALKARRKDLGKDRQQLQDQDEGVKQKLRAHNSKIDANETQIRALNKKVPPGTTELSPEVRQEIDKLWIDAGSLKNEKKAIEGERKAILANLGILDKRDQETLVWQRESRLYVYKINRKGQEIDVILESEKGKGMANAYGQKWSSTDADISRAESAIQQLIPLLDIDLSALFNEPPMLEERAMTAPPSASMPEGWNDEERMRWLNGHREERGE